MAKPHPLVSFIIPFHGSVELLKRCLNSIQAQTDGDFEVIVVDDGSPEDGEVLAQSFGERFRYVRLPTNSSAFQARNRGVVEAKGDYVVPVDPDDYVLPDLVDELRRNLNLSPQLPPDIIIFNVEQDEGGRVTPHWCRYAPGRFTSERVLDLMTQKKLQWSVWAKAIRRSLWEELVREDRFGDGVYMNASEDFCIVVPLILKSRVIEVIDAVGYRYWQNPQSICHGVLPGKAWRAIRDTLVAQRLVTAFARAGSCSGEVLDKIRFISRMIIRWWVLECVRTVKGRLLAGRKG